MPGWISASPGLFVLVVVSVVAVPVVSVEVVAEPVVPVVDVVAVAVLLSANAATGDSTRVAMIAEAISFLVNFICSHSFPSVVWKIARTYERNLCFKGVQN